ncbi:Hypothetical protein HVR_LOCUS1310 [uncultured virus]|nr:Hypothetical protein HVR_LOCUS1310 [uncultured virus]
MVNPGLVLLITLAIVLTIVVIGLLIWAGVSYYNYTQGAGGTGATGLPSCSQNINISDLTQIPLGTGTNCTQNGITGSLYYVGAINSNYDYVVAPWQTQPLVICIGYCTSYTGGNCSGPTASGKTAQENFDNCMSQLSSTTCTPPIPIAARGTILYYAYAPTCGVCDCCGSGCIT